MEMLSSFTHLHVLLNEILIVKCRLQTVLSHTMKMNVTTAAKQDFQNNIFSEFQFVPQSQHMFQKT